jgi:hypothetical protein
VSSLDEVSALLERIRDSAKGREDFEADNLRRDLSVLAARLESGAYKESDFAARNVYDVPRRTREFLRYFAGWNAQAARWGALLAPHISGVREVIDLCPGWAPKIELALARLRFGGRVRMIDKDENAMRELLSFFALLDAPLRAEAIRADVFDTPPASEAELVVANHVVDDVLLDRWAPKMGLDKARIYEEEAALAEAWERILERRSEIEEELPRELAEALSRHVLRGGVLIVSHYPSNIEQLIGTAEITETFAALFRLLRRALGALGLDERDPPSSDRGDEGTVAVFRKP